MASKAYKKIKAGLEDAIAHAKGEATGARVTLVPVGPSHAEQVAVATLEAIVVGYRRSTAASCSACGCPRHGGHKLHCPIGLAVRALETIARLKNIGV